MLQTTKNSVLKVIDHINTLTLANIEEDHSVSFRYSSWLLVESVLKFVQSEKLQCDIINIEPDLIMNIKGKFVMKFH